MRETVTIADMPAIGDALRAIEDHLTERIKNLS
jgi:hypothetical protein